MQFEVGDGRTVLRFVDLAHLYITTQVGEFDDLGIETGTAGRLLVTPVVSLRTQGRCHDLVGFRTYFEAGSHDLVGIQQRVGEQDGTFAFQRFLGIGDGLFVSVIDTVETFLFETDQFVQHRFVFGGIIAFLLFHISKSQFDGFHIQPFQIALKRIQVLYFLYQFEILVYLRVEIFFVADLLGYIRIVRSVLQPGNRIIHSLFFNRSIRGDQPGVQAVQHGAQHPDLFRIFSIQFFCPKSRNRIQCLEEHASATRRVVDTDFGFKTDILATHRIH